MKKKIVLFIMAALVAVSALSMTGCASQALYGQWKLVQTGDPDTGEYTDYEFIFPVVVRINKDGTVEMLDSMFGYFEKDGQEFSFWYDEDGEKGEEITGGWEMIGYDLYIYPDNDPTVYKFSRLSDATATPAAE